MDNLINLLILYTLRWNKMVRPRVFVSSTYYDLRHIRNNIKAFLENMGFDAVLFERGDIPFSPNVPIDESCYEEISNCHILILIIGGCYGSPTTEESKKIETKSPDTYNSVTKKEFDTALKNKIPIFILIEKNVDIEYKTYKKNRANESVKYAHVDHINIFKLLDEIQVKQKSIFIQPFENFDDISGYLREQFAGLFADFLLKRKKEMEFKDLEERIIELKEVTEALKQYTESIMKEIKPENYIQIIDSEQKRIESSNAIRFVEEGFIAFILKRILKTQIMEPVEVFHAFEKAISLHDFLNKLGINSEYDAFEKGDLDAAKEEFEYLKEKYFGKVVREKSIISIAKIEK